MNERKPPALAAWLLRRIGVTEANEPLIGDLAEELRNGRSAAWYWRQTISLVALRPGPPWRAAFVGWAL